MAILLLVFRLNPLKRFLMRAHLLAIVLFTFGISSFAQAQGTILFSQSGLSGASGSSLYFSFNVPPGINTLVVSGSSTGPGYSELVARANVNPAPADLGRYPSVVYNVQPGPWFVLIYGHTSYSRHNYQVTGYRLPTWEYDTLSQTPNASLGGKETCLPSRVYSYFNYYKGTDGKIWALWYGGGATWSQAPLTSVGNVDDWLTENTNYNQLYYKGTDNRIWALWYGAGRWNQISLTPTANVAGNVTTDNSTNFTYYRGTDNNIWVLWYGAGRWNQAALTTSARVAGEVTVDPTYRFTYYRGTDSHLWVVWYGAGRWNEAKLSTLGNVAGNLVADPGFGTYYLDSSNAVWAVWFTGTNWAQTSLGVVSGTVSGALSLYGPRGVVFCGTDGVARYLGNNGSQWSISQLGPSGLNLRDTLRFNSRDGFIYGRTSNGHLGVFNYR
jgi:hypothetical protein